MKNILLIIFTLLLNGCVQDARDIGGAVSVMTTGTDYVSGRPERGEKWKKEAEEKRKQKQEYYKTPEGQLALKKEQEERQKRIDLYGCKVRNTITHNNVEIGRAVRKSWYDQGGKRYRYIYTTYLECRDCGKRSTGTAYD